MKTKEDAAKYHAHIGQYGVRKENAEKSFLVCVEFEQRWIPIEEELPPKLNDKNFSFSVIAKSRGNKGSKYFIAHYNYNHNFWCDEYRGIIRDYKITHWRKIDI